ncbi:MAG: gamma-glutamyl-gamma-aminobutyrate hydrolase family protein [Planctomycetota bacterium]|jgi:putative glutamine amidotransferase|nr:gamma-glutamyl-gamma-aminobutyrate hydrolase family protein [Planctomycetota bacterium]|tara:strand:- start:27104 stop:27826 length:723 start_codon:yes stop_codon:yes gene_type:complete
MDERPLIGLSVEVLDAPHYEGRRRYQLFSDYAGCLRKAGAIPILIPGDTPPSDLDSILDCLDGLLMTGGDDVDLRPLGGPPPEDTCRPIPIEQQELNLHLVAHAKARDMPTLGICLGMQVIGLANQSSYIQHLDSAEEHTKGIEHQVVAKEGSRLAKILGLQPITVASFHHQALKETGQGLCPAAYSEDGLLEAIEDSEMTFHIGVQWHPERLPDSEPSLALFSSFVAAAQAYGREEPNS